MRLAIIAGLSLAIVLQGLDLVTFQMAVNSYGSHGESNMLMALLYEKTGILGVSLVKMVSIAIASLIVINLTEPRRTIGVVVIGFMGLLGTVTNVLVVRVYG